MGRTIWLIALACALGACATSSEGGASGGVLGSGSAEAGGSATAPVATQTTGAAPEAAATDPVVPPPAEGAASSPPTEPAAPATAAPTGAAQRCGPGERLEDVDGDAWGDCVVDEIAVNTWAAQAAAEATGLPPGTPCAYPASIVAGQTAQVTCSVVNLDASEGTWSFDIGSDSSITAGVVYVETKPAPPPPTTLAPIRPLVGAATDPRFGTCKEAKAHGYGPYYSDEVEYGWYRDADSDGKVCE